MKKLGFALALIIVMLPLIPYAGFLALYPVSQLHHGVASSSSFSFSLFLYMFAHANLFHWFLNSWCLMMLHHVLSVHRCVAAYISAVFWGIIWSSFASASALPVLGFSAILFWFMGYLLPYFWHRDRFQVLILAIYLVVGLLVPNLAGSFHLALFLMGFAYYHCELWFRRLINFIFE